MISRFTGSLTTGTGTFLYHAIDGKFSKAFLVPTLGCYLICIGNYCNAPNVSTSQHLVQLLEVIVNLMP